MMKVLALVFMLAVAVYARPPKMDDLEGGDKPDEGTKLFLNLVKLCIRLEEEAGSDDKRSWDAVFQLFGGVCDGIKAEMEKEFGDVDMPEKRGKSGGMRKGPGGKGDKDDDSDMKGDKSGMKGDKDGMKGDKSGMKGDKDGMKGDKSGMKGDKSYMKGDKSDMSGPKPTGDPKSFMGPKPTGDPKSFMGPKPTGDPKSFMDKRGDDKQAQSPQQNLLKICFALVKMGEEMEAGKADKRSMEEVLSGMEQVCLAAFTQAKDDGMGSD